MNLLRCLPLLALALVTLPAGAQDFQPRLDVSSALVVGTSYELVLRDGSYKAPVSRLTWPVPPSLSLQVNAVFPWAPWTTTTLGLRALKPLKQGTMVDEDWNVSNYYGNGIDLVYGRSAHEAFLTAHYTFQAEQGFHWGPLTLAAGGIYRWVTWEGWNGQGTYQATDRTSTYTFSGLLIAYRQEWTIPYLGASWAFAGDGWQAVPTLRVGPYTWCSDMDNHNYSGSATQTYLDQTKGGLFGQFALETTFAGGPGWTWGARAGAEVAWGAIGDTVATHSFQSTDGTRLTYTPDKDGAGTWFTEMSVGLFVRN